MHWTEILGCRRILCGLLCHHILNFTQLCFFLWFLCLWFILSFLCGCSGFPSPCGIDGGQDRAKVGSVLWKVFLKYLIGQSREDGEKVGLWQLELFGKQSRGQMAGPDV